MKRIARIIVILVALCMISGCSIVISTDKKDSAKESEEDSEISLISLNSLGCEGVGVYDEDVIKDGYVDEGVDNYGKVYSNVIFERSDLHVDYTYVEYTPAKKYSRLKGTIYVNEYGKKVNAGMNNWERATMTIYGDDNVLYTCTGFDPKTKPKDIVVDIEGVDIVKIEFVDAINYDGGCKAIIGFGDSIVY